MKRSMTGSALAALLALAGCGDAPAPAPKAAETKSAIANPFHDRLMALDPLRQRIALGRALRDAKLSCDRVEAAGFRQDYENLKMWTAECKTRRYAVFIAPNADVQVRDCREHAQLGLPSCGAAEGGSSK